MLCQGCNDVIASFTLASNHCTKIPHFITRVPILIAQQSRQCKKLGGLKSLASQQRQHFWQHKAAAIFVFTAINRFTTTIYAHQLSLEIKFKKRGKCVNLALLRKAEITALIFSFHKRSIKGKHVYFHKICKWLSFEKMFQCAQIQRM